MRETLRLPKVKSMWRWMLLALLLSSIVSENFAAPKSIYRIEEVIANANYEAICRKIPLFSHSFENPADTNSYSEKRQLQRERLRFLSRILHLHAELAIANAANLQPILMRATGYQLKSKLQPSEEPFHFHS